MNPSSGGEKTRVASSTNSSFPEELTNTQQDIESQISLIFKTSEYWSMYLRRKEQRKRILYAVLSGAIVWVAFFMLVALQDDLNYSIVGLFPATSLFGGSLINYMLLLVFPISIVVAFVSYFIQARIKSPFIQLQALIASFQATGKEGGERSAVSALTIIERMIRLLPEVKRMRYSEASLFGVIAFLLSLLITARSSSFGTGVSVIVGVLIWLYFRYEATIEYGRELSRFEKWQEKLEEEKKEFIASL